MPNATFPPDTSRFQQSIWYSLDRKITATHARYWYSFYIHVLGPVFLQQLQAHVQFFNIYSSSWHFTQGLPQSFILTPLFFLFYINNLASLFKGDAVVALFADDVSILTTTHQKEDAEATAQLVVNSILTWSQEW